MKGMEAEWPVSCNTRQFLKKGKTPRNGPAWLFVSQFCNPLKLRRSSCELFRLAQDELSVFASSRMKGDYIYAGCFSSGT